MRRFGVVFAVAFFAACGKPASSQPPAASAAEPAFIPQPASGPIAAAPAGAPLPALQPEADGSALPTAPESWWVGKEMDGQNRPLHCTQMQDQWGHLGLTSVGPEAEAVYLTFDFGYETGYSGQILDTLAEKDAKGNFFLVTGYMEGQPETVQRMVDEGHSVGSHSISHPGAPGGVPGLSAEEQTAEIEAGQALMKDTYGYNCRLFRFPEGIFSPYSLQLAAQRGIYCVFWGYAYKDWDAENQPPKGEALQSALAAAHPGAIYLLHPQKTNADMLGDLIDGLRAMGYEPKAL